MNADEYRAALANLGLTQTEAADVFGFAHRTSHRFAMGEREIPWSVEAMLNLMVARYIQIDEITAAPKHKNLPVSVAQLLYLLDIGMITPAEVLTIGLGMRHSKSKYHGIVREG